MDTLDRKLLRDFKQNWPLLCAVSAIIAVGISCFVGMLSTAQNLELARSSYYSLCRLAEFWVDLKKVPTSELNRLAVIPGISEFRDRIQFQILLDVPDSIKPIGALALSLPDNRAAVINNIVITRGTYFTSTQPNEVIISEKFATARNIQPGDTISGLLNNQKKDLRVIGTAISAEFVYMASPGSMVDEPGNYGLIYLKRSFAEDTFGFNGSSNSVIGLLTPESRLEDERIVKQLTERLKPFGVFAGLTRAKQFSPMVLDGEMKQLKNMAVIFPLFFLVVAALVLNVLMLRIAEQQRSVIGTLKALGYDNRSLLTHYIKFAAITGLAGGLAGCLLGHLFGIGMTRMYITYFSFPSLVSRLYPLLLITGLLISLTFSILGTFRGVRKIMRLQPAEAMRQASPTTGGAIYLERFKRLWKLFDAQWQMIFRSLARNKGRTGVALFSACIGSSIVVLAFGFVDSLDLMIRVQFDTIMQSDYHVSFRTELSSEGLEEMNRLPGVILAEPVYNLACTFRNGNHEKRGAISGIVQNSQLTKPMEDMTRAARLPPYGLLMTNRLMNSLAISPGDYIEVTPVKGDRTPRMVAVAQRVESMLGLAVYADVTWLNHIFSGEDVLNEVRIIASPSTADRQALLQRIKELPGIESITDLGEQKRALEEQMSGAMRAMAVIMILFAAIIFFGTILNGTLIALSERQREMATFRTMGYYQNEVSRIFLRENLSTNIIGTILGLPLGYFLLVATMKGFVTDTYSFPAIVAGVSYISTIILAIIFVLISHLVVKRNLRQMNWVEALSIKE